MSANGREIWRRVYLDHAATTPMTEVARAALIDGFDVLGNPSSIHQSGQHARQALEEAREAIAASLQATSSLEVVFTGTGTESVNLAIKGLWWKRPEGANRIIVAAGEHHATIDTVAWLEAQAGAVVDVVPLDEEGRIRLDALAATISDDPGSVALVTMLWANNEVGTIQPVREIAQLCAHSGVPLHFDAIAAYGQIPVDVRSVRGDSPAGVGLVAASISAHKMGGPTGIAALWVDRSAKIDALAHGGGQQRGLRSGTQDVASALAFAAAARELVYSLDVNAARMLELRDRIIDGIRSRVPEAVLSGPGNTTRMPGDERPDERLPGNVHFGFPGCEGDSLLFAFDESGIAVSTGSACRAGVAEPSHVLLAMGRNDDDARGALRITLGHSTDVADVDALLEALPAAYARARDAGLSSRLSTFNP